MSCHWNGQITRTSVKMERERDVQYTRISNVKNIRKRLSIYSQTKKLFDMTMFPERKQNNKPDLRESTLHKCECRKEEPTGGWFVLCGIEHGRDHQNHAGLHPQGASRRVAEVPEPVSSRRQENKEDAVHVFTSGNCNWRG
jgi:hypothetical protein